LRRSREESMQQNGFWLSAISSSLMNDEDPAEVLKFFDRVQALTADKVRRAARAYITPDRYVRVVLNPESVK
jgi:zinc protease